MWRIYEGYEYPLLRSFLTANTATANSGNRAYDGTTDGLGVSWSTSPDGSLLSGTLSEGNTASANVGSYTVTPSGQYSNQQGYDIEYLSGTVEITQALLTISGMTAANRVYDATTDASITTYGVLSGLVGGETLTLETGAVSASFDDKNVGTGKTVTASGYAISNGTGLASNYSLGAGSAVATADITAKTLSVTGTTAENKVYDGTTDATVSGGSLSGVFAGDTVNLGQSGSFDSKDVGSGKTVTYSSSISGGDAGNYSLSGGGGNTTADITPASLVVTANGDSKVHDGVAYSGGNGVSYSGFVAGENASELTGSLTYGGDSQGAVNIGYYTITPAGLAAANYLLSFVDGRLEILPGTSYNTALFGADHTGDTPPGQQDPDQGGGGNGFTPDDGELFQIVDGGIRLPEGL